MFAKAIPTFETFDHATALQPSTRTADDRFCSSAGSEPPSATATFRWPTDASCAAAKGPRRGSHRAASAYAFARRCGSLHAPRLRRKARIFKRGRDARYWRRAGRSPPCWPCLRSSPFPTAQAAFIPAQDSCWSSPEAVLDQGPTVEPGLARAAQRQGQRERSRAGSQVAARPIVPGGRTAPNAPSLMMSEGRTSLVPQLR